MESQSCDFTIALKRSGGIWWQVCNGSGLSVQHPIELDWCRSVQHGLSFAGSALCFDHRCSAPDKRRSLGRTKFIRILERPLSADTTPTYLRRYTDLPALLHLLASSEITLLDPKTWDDRNDSFFMSLYKERNDLKTVLALCFTQAPETYHHWRVFSNGASGVCIVFERSDLLEDLSENPDIFFDSVDYLTLNQARKRNFLSTELPFLKRYGFKPENEFRVVYKSKQWELLALNVPIRLSSIRSISLSPWMHNDLSKSTEAAIKSIKDCAKIKVSRSTLISNEQWKSYAKSAN